MHNCEHAGLSAALSPGVWMGRGWGDSPGARLRAVELEHVRSVRTPRTHSCCERPLSTAQDTVRSRRRRRSARSRPSCSGSTRASGGRIPTPSTQLGPLYNVATPAYLDLEPTPFLRP